MKCLIIEDEPLAAEALADLLREIAGDAIELVGVGSTPQHACDLVKQHDPDLLFVDIRLPGKSGIDLVSELEADAIVVFTTAYDEFALTAFELGAIDYILKPVERERLQLCLSRVLKNPESGRAGAVTSRLRHSAAGGHVLESLFVEQNGEILTVPIASIVRVESHDGYACIQTIHGREHALRLSLKTLETKIGPDRLVRLNRSCLANPDHILSYKRHPDRRLRARFDDGVTVTASRRFSRDFRAGLHSRQIP